MDREPLKILLAEDNLLSQKMLAFMIRNWGMSAVACKNGREAVDHAASERFDICIMDIQMPEMDGLQAFSEIRKKGISIPVIALTADDRQEERERCLSAGMDACLAKPVNEGALKDTILSLRRNAA